jgi:hypothetical protein
MKKLMTAICIIAFATAAFAITVPEAVKNTFAKKFPAATGVKWDKENAHEYEAGFTLEGKSCSANFSDAGEWLETESSIDFYSLPATIRQSFTTAHKTATVKAAAKIETAKGTVKYEVEYKSGSKTKEVIYNDDGTIAK